MELREMTEAEQKYTYAQSHQLEAQTGCRLPAWGLWLQWEGVLFQLVRQHGLSENAGISG